MRINVRISTKSLIYSSGNRNPSNKNHRQFLGVESVPECNKLHMKGEPLLFASPKVPSTTLPAAFRLCASSVCDLDLHRHRHIAVYIETMPSEEPTDSSKQR